MYLQQKTCRVSGYSECHEKILMANWWGASIAQEKPAEGCVVVGKKPHHVGESGMGRVLK